MAAPGQEESPHPIPVLMNSLVSEHLQHDGLGMHSRCLRDAPVAGRLDANHT